MKTACYFALLVTAGSTPFLSSSEPETSEGKKKLFEKLRFVDDAYTGKRFREIELTYRKTLRDRDSRKWQGQVKEAGDSKRRKSFLGEYFAFGDDYELIPLKEFTPGRIVTKKHRLQILLFRPGKPRDKNEPLSEKLRSTTYIIIRKHVPAGNDNPYGVFVSQALQGYSTTQLKRLVEAYRSKL